MVRKTFTLGAAAMAAAGTLALPGVEGAAALAQAADTSLNLAGRDAPSAASEPVVELVPQTPAFISEEVVQPLPENTPRPSIAHDTPAAESLGALVGMVGAYDAPLSDEMRCLAGAVYFEARGEPLAGQLAVAQVIINRSQDNRFPASYCSVVAQPGQFSFMRGRHMPAVRTGTAAWTRARAIARIAHEGLWSSEVGEAVFFHANYVRPSWSHRKTRMAQISTHIFYR